MFLLDTNVVSELRKAGRAHPNVTAWAASTRSQELSVSAITVMELEIGVLRLERRDPIQGALFRAWMEDGVLAAFQGRILPLDLAVCRRCAALHVPDPRPERDALIAATALAHGLTVVTRNVTDFAPTGVACLDPWLDQG
jgi:predicted nucleic acid-binding protein